MACPTGQLIQFTIVKNRFLSDRLLCAKLADCLLPKLRTRVRFSSPAPHGLVPKTGPDLHDNETRVKFKALLFFNAKNWSREFLIRPRDHLKYPWKALL
jgi:hypothetical protein